MSQYFPGVIDPETTDGTELADLLSQTFASLLSQHSGPSAPIYATAGTLWLGTANPALWILYVFDGAEWVALLYINPSTNAISVPGITQGAMGAVILAQPTRAAVLDVLDLGAGSLLAQTAVTGSATSGLGWTRLLGSMTFTAISTSTLFVSDGRFRHTQNNVDANMLAQIRCVTTGQLTSFQRGLGHQNQYIPYSLHLPVATTPGANYTAHVEFTQTSANSSAEIDGILSAIAL